jgi:hypothetical protein
MPAQQLLLLVVQQQLQAMWLMSANPLRMSCQQGAPLQQLVAAQQMQQQRQRWHCRCWVQTLQRMASSMC